MKNRRIVQGFRGSAILVAAAAIGAAACGSDDGGSTDAQEDSPPVKCQRFAALWCQTAMGCLVENGLLPEAERDENVRLCFDVAVAEAQCADVVAVTASFDPCMLDIEAMPCSAWDVPEAELAQVLPPSSCEAVLLVQ